MLDKNKLVERLEVVIASTEEYINSYECSGEIEAYMYSKGMEAAYETLLTVTLEGAFDKNENGGAII